MSYFLQSLWRGFEQDLRSKELRWLLVALIVSVSALTSVGFLADRMQRAFEFDARQLLASDFLIAADQPIPEIFLHEAKNHNLQIAQTVVFPSMATVGTQSKLASVKAVSNTYPLRGSLQLDQLQKNSATLSPTPGSVWVEQALLSSLRTKVGDLLRLGDREFEISGVLLRELDRGAGFMNFAPRVMMSLDDLNSTGLIGLGSRVTYRVLVAGSDKDVLVYQAWAKRYIESAKLRGLRVESLENAQPMMRKTLERAERFLSLVALLTAMIAAVAIALTARRYMLGQADSCAALKCFGATRSAIIQKQIQTLLVIGLTAAVVGSAFGYITQELLTRILGNLLLSNLPAISLAPVFFSILFALILLLGFAGPPLLSLANISPMRLIRKEFGPTTAATAWLVLFAVATSGILICLAARDWKLALWVGLSFSGAILVFALLARLLLWGLSGLRLQRFSTRFAITTMNRSAGFAVMQITALGIAIMAILMIFLLRQDLLNAWRGNIPADAPNRFMINIQGDQKQGITALLEAGGIAGTEYSPMVRGRLIEVNGQSISPSDYSEENAKRLVDREFNLSYTKKLPLGNHILAGEWITGDGPQISIESGIAKTLKLKLGDQMTFEVAGEKISAPITSLRKLDWSSMRVNFFVIMPPSQLSTMPQSWITSYYQNPQREPLDFQLSQSFPNLTLIDVSASLQQIQEVLNKLSAALGLLFTFTIVASVLVLIAAIAATQDERFKNAALLKALGASRTLLSQIARVELLIIGLSAGVLAGFAAGMAAWSLGRYVMDIEFYAFVPAILMGAAFGVTASLAAGYRFQKRIQSSTAVVCLREA